MAWGASEAQAISDAGMDESCTQQVYDETAFYKKLELKKKIISKGGGTSWTWGARIRKLNRTSAVGPRDKIDFIENETIWRAEDIARYYVGKTVIPWDKLAENKGEAQRIDIVSEKAKELKEDFMHTLSSDTFAANATGIGLTPLSLIVGTGIYAGINPANCDPGAWESQVDAATTALSIYGPTSISTMANRCRFGKRGVNFHLTTYALRSQFESILEEHHRFVEKLGDKQMADAGFENVAFHGAGVFGDNYVPTGHWYGLDMDSLFLMKDPDYYLKVTPWKEISEEFMYSLQKKMCARLQLGAEMRRTHFKFTALVAA